MEELNRIIKKQGGFDLIKKYLKNGLFFTALSEFLILGKNKIALEILRLAINLKVKKRLEKKYKWKLEELDKNYKENVKITDDRKIWFCWMQGIENAPIIVKKCFQSIKNNIKDRDIVIINENNYREYVEFPEFIQKKIDAGIIKGAHMSDLLRLELLEKYGGTWIDATVYCTDSNISEFYLNSDLFLFQSLKPGKDGHSTIISNWFITAKPYHKFIIFTKELLYDYWKNNDELVDYFIFHYFFQMVIDKYPDEWKKVVPICNSMPHVLLLRLYDKYDPIVWENIKKVTPFHKVSYKLDEKLINTKESYFQKIFGKE